MAPAAALQQRLILAHLHRIIRSAKYVHLMFNDKFNKPYVDFLNRNYPQEEHLVLCKRWFSEIPFPTGNNVLEVNQYKGLPLGICRGKIVCHSLFDQEIVELLHSDRGALEKSSWVVWGGDLYEAPDDAANVFVRENFAEYVCTQEGDARSLQKRFNLKNNNIKGVLYTFPVTLEMLETARAAADKDSAVRIQINNSADMSTLEILDKLAKFKDENVLVSTVLSYGVMKYKEQIIAKGKEIFGNKFEYVDSMMDPLLYAKRMASQDILILGQNRQKGGGNFLMAAALGVKAFIRSDVTSYTDYNRAGMCIADTLRIDDMGFEEFVFFDRQSSSRNMELASKFFTDEYLKERWDCVYDNV